MNLWSWAKPHWSRDRVKDSCSCLAIVQHEPRVSELAILGQAEEPVLGRANSSSASTEMDCSKPGFSNAQHGGRAEQRHCCAERRPTEPRPSPPRRHSGTFTVIRLPELTGLQLGAATRPPEVTGRTGAPRTARPPDARVAQRDPALRASAPLQWREGNPDRGGGSTAGLTAGTEPLPGNAALCRGLRPREVTRCARWKADMISLGKYL